MKIGVACLFVAALNGCAFPVAMRDIPKKIEPLSDVGQRIQERWAQQIKNVDSVAIDSTSKDSEQELPTQWWRELQDPVLDTFIDLTLKSSPTLRQTLERLNEARAQLSGAVATKLPRVDGSLGTNRGSSQLTGAEQTAVVPRMNFSWEIDLFGKLQYAQSAAQARFMARESDLKNARLMLQAQIASEVALRRACTLQIAFRLDDLSSRKKSLDLIELRQLVGQVAPMDVARSRVSWADAQNQLATTVSSCRQSSNMLVYLTGLSLTDIESKFVVPSVEDASVALRQKPPKIAINQMPATVIVQHPKVLAAIQNADAAYNDLGNAEALRRPSLSLNALLGKTNLFTMGRSITYTDWNIGASLLGPLFDGGRSKANADAANARYRLAVAHLDEAVISALRDVEDSLVQFDTAEQRIESMEKMVASGRELLKGSESSFKAGRMSLFEIEDARRTLSNSIAGLTNAQRDLTLSWISLVRAMGHGNSMQSFSN